MFSEIPPCFSQLSTTTPRQRREPCPRDPRGRGCGAHPTDGQAAQDNTVEEDGAWAPSEEWWSKDQEIAMCHEVIDELMSSR